MDPLLFASPVRKVDHLGGRYPRGVGRERPPAGGRSARLRGARSLLGYPDRAPSAHLELIALLQPWLIFLLPNMALTGAVLFTVAALSRRLVAVYISGFVLFMGCMITGDRDFALSAIDPAGLTTLTRITAGWSAAELNSRLVTVTSGLVWNRVLWLAVTAGVLFLVHRRFQFSHAEGGNARRARRDAPDSPRNVVTASVRVATSFGPGITVQQALAIARNSLREIVWNRWFAAVWVACALWCSTLVEKTTLRPFDTTTWPATMLVTAVLSMDFLVGVFVLVGLYASELVWKDRDVGVADIVDATPVADGTALIGRLSRCSRLAHSAGGVDGRRHDRPGGLGLLQVRTPALRARAVRDEPSRGRADGRAGDSRAGRR